MVNLKHTISAIVAIAMIGSLATSQATDVTPVKAEKSDIEIRFNQPEILVGDGEGIVFGELPELDGLKKGKGYVLIQEDKLKIRKEASDTSEVVAELECAEEVDILFQEGNWYCIKYKDTKAYAFADYITMFYENARDNMLKYFSFQTGYINEDGVNIRDGAGLNTNVLDQVDAGTGIYVTAYEKDGWLKVLYGRNYDVGYIMSTFVTIDGKEDIEKVNNAKKERISKIVKKGVVASGGTIVNVREFPYDNAEVIETIPDKSNIKIITKGSKWTKIAMGDMIKTGYVKTKLIMDEEQINAKKRASSKAKTKSYSTQVSSSKPAVKGSGQAIVNEAEKYLGISYVYGGSSPSTGFDCSGLVQYVCKKVGISVNRSSAAQYSNGVAVARSNLQPGDLIFFSKGNGISHVVIYAGNGNVIHAPSPGKKVCYATLSYICSYSSYVGARRVA